MTRTLILMTTLLTLAACTGGDLYGGGSDTGSGSSYSTYGSGSNDY